MLWWQIDGDYSLNGIVLTVFPIYGDGPFYVQVFDVTMAGNGSLGLDETGNYVQVLKSSLLNTEYTTTTMSEFYDWMREVPFASAAWETFNQRHSIDSRPLIFILSLSLSPSLTSSL